MKITQPVQQFNTHLVRANLWRGRNVSSVEWQKNESSNESLVVNRWSSRIWAVSAAGVFSGVNHTMTHSTEETRPSHFSLTTKLSVTAEVCDGPASLHVRQGNSLPSPLSGQGCVIGGSMDTTFIKHDCKGHSQQPYFPLNCEPYEPLIFNGIKAHFQAVAYLFCIQDRVDMWHFLRWRSCFVLIPAKKETKHVG